MSPVTSPGVLGRRLYRREDTRLIVRSSSGNLVRCLAKFSAVGGIVSGIALEVHSESMRDVSDSS